MAYYRCVPHNDSMQNVCDTESYTRQAKHVSMGLAVAAVVAVVLVCLGQSTRRLETGTIACSITAACAVVLFFSYVTVTTQRTPCLQKDMKCEAVDDIKVPMMQAVNWMASFVALAVVLHMSRAKAGAWKMVGSYFGISLVGFGLMTAAGAYVDHALRPVLCTPPTSV